MKKYICVAMLWMGMLPLAAHPHVFIGGTLGPRISSSGKLLQGVEIRWSFDRIYSAQMIFDFDRNQDGKISPAESRTIYEEAFVHLKDWDYFLQVKPAGRKEILAPATDFRAAIKDGQMIYRFYVPFVQTLPLSTEYVLFLEDPEYFIAFDSSLDSSLDFAGNLVGSREFMVENEFWGDYPVNAISVKGF